MPFVTVRYIFLAVASPLPAGRHETYIHPAFSQGAPLILCLVLTRTTAGLGATITTLRPQVNLTGLYRTTLRFRLQSLTFHFFLQGLRKRAREKPIGALPVPVQSTIPSPGPESVVLKIPIHITYPDYRPSEVTDAQQCCESGHSYGRGG